MLVRKFPRRTLLLLRAATLALAACNVGATAAPTVDVNAINTAAVATAMGQISAQLTQTALAAPTTPPPPTDTPLSLATVALPTTAAGASPTTGVPGALPTLSFNSTPNTTPLAGFTPISSPAAPVNTVVSGDTCNNNIFVADVTVPDDTVFKPGVDFEKTWSLQNTGTCTWDDGYQLVFVSGDNALDPANFRIDESSEFVSSGETADMTVTLTAPLAEGTYTANYRMQSDTGVFFGETIYVRIKVQK
ncbi:MAG TPA: NBR1-Ig-like domain-containing protein [Anaerolineales bacterium]|nr:NBR1-Ig-like domain-containing protein [Anaerolineales bacterium]